ncbi:MAG: acyl-[ACP]--phospholipid O-acyltransferase [Pseudomonadota bacterium]
MAKSQFSLLKQINFLPLFVSQFTGAFHDNLFKNAMTVLILYNVRSSHMMDPKLLVTLAAGIFIIPFVLFSAFGGQLAEKYDKARVIRMLKVAELAIAVVGCISILSNNIPLSFLTLFLLGTHSALFGPSKYSILPQHLKQEDLISGNALLNGGTFLSILLGTVIGVSVVSIPTYGKIIISIIIMACAVAGWLFSRLIPSTPHDDTVKLDINIVQQIKKTVSFIFTMPRNVILAVLGVSWFFFLGGMFLSQFPNFTKETLGANEHVLTLFLTVFSVGICIGGLLNNTLLKGRVEATYVPLAALGLSLFSLDLYWASYPFEMVRQHVLVDVGTFIQTFQNWRIIFDIFMIAFCGGLFVVPLNAFIQHNTECASRSRIVAGAGIMDSLFIIASSVISAILITLGFSIAKLFLFFAMANCVVTLYICRLIPDYLVKSFLQIIFKLFYKVEIKGLENIEKAGKRVVIVCNHVSLFDAPLLAAFLPGRPMFAIDTYTAQKFWIKPFLKIINTFSIDPTNPYALKALINKVQEDHHVVIFPEGRLTQTGALMKVYEGPGMVADKADAMILPMRIDGVQHTPFTYLKGKVPSLRFPKITITVLEPHVFKPDSTITGRKRRQVSARMLYDVMENMLFVTEDRHQTLFQALLAARHVNGFKAEIIEDVERKPLSFRKLVRASMVVGRKIAARTEIGENVGILLPNSSAAVVTFFGLQAYGRVPAMLNFSAGAHAVSSACRTAEVKIVITSRRFVDLARLTDMVAQLSASRQVIYLEDLKKTINLFDKLYAVVRSARRLHGSLDIYPESPAVILFTSGSEGEPKGVALSHINLMSNIIQLACRVDFNRQDIIFNALPIFHSFGLTGGMLLPILNGVKTFLYPSPLHYRIIPEVVYSINATIMFGTDTFLSGYARMAHNYDFYRMRYIFAGAEKIKEETRRLYMERFGVRVFEGYGTTETSPVIAVNSPLFAKAGSVGRFLTGMSYRLEAVPGVDEGGRLFVHGPNVMLGYFMPDFPGVLQPAIDSWHDTGDIVDVDEEGFIKILGRVKRFAKIAGEMVSLNAVEAFVQKVWPDAVHAVIAIPDDRKGEQLVLITTEVGALKEPLLRYASENGLSPLNVPAKIISVDKIPVLGTGKTDYVVLKNMY